MIKMIRTSNFPFISILILAVIVEIIPIQLQSQNGGEVKRSSVEGFQLNQCLSVSERSEAGVCLGKELLNKLNDYDESESFSLVTGVTFVRDEKLPRDIASFLDKDPLDYRSIIEDASGLISKRSLRWDLGKFYPGLVMKIGPTLANGVLEFVIDPRVKDRSFNGKMTTGRLLARNFLLPFLLGIKFHIATLLPLLLGLLLIASKKAFLLAKIALFAVTLFTTRNSNFGIEQNYFDNFFNPESSSPAEHYHNYHSNGGGGYYTGHKHHYHGEDHRHEDHHYHGDDHGDYHLDRHHYYKEKSDNTEPTVAPISPGELRDRLARLFVTKKDNINAPREDNLDITARTYPWTPISAGG